MPPVVLAKDMSGGAPELEGGFTCHRLDVGDAANPIGSE
jgi:hypothetical protein